MNKIVFVNQATGYLTIDIINAFTPHYDEVALIAGSIRVQDIPLDAKVNWSKIALYDRGKPVRKLFSWIKGTFQILYLLLTRYRDYEIFYFTIPPFAYLLSFFLRNRFAVLIFDVYPDVLKIYGIKETNLLYKVWTLLNKRLFAKAYRVFTIGSGMARLLTAYVSRDRIVEVPLWTGLTQIMPVAKDQNSWLHKIDLQNKFIVQYSGNIGYTHNVEVLIEVAKALHNNEAIHFLIIGRGEKVEHIRSLINEYSLSNCTLLPFQPDDQLVYSLAAADLGLIVIDEKIVQVSLPSKIYNLQAVGVPLLCIAPPDSELDRHVHVYDNGRCFRPDDIIGIANFITEMKENPNERQRLSANSRKAAASFTMKNAEKYYTTYVS